MRRSRFGPDTPADVFEIVSETVNTIEVERKPGGGHLDTLIFFANVMALERKKDVKFTWNSHWRKHIRASRARRWLRTELRRYLRSMAERILKSAEQFSKELKREAGTRWLYWGWVNSLVAGAYNHRNMVGDSRAMKWYLNRFPDEVFSHIKPPKKKRAA